MTQKQLDDILKEPFYPKKVETRKNMQTTHDDNDGEPLSGFIDICVSEQGDVFIKTFHKGIGYLRFRTMLGGGKFLKIRNALLILAEAIRQEGSIT